MTKVEIMPQNSELTKEQIEEIRKNPRFMPLEGHIIAKLLDLSTDEMTQEQINRMNEWMSEGNEQNRIQLSERVCKLLHEGRCSDQEIIDIVTNEFQEQDLQKAA